MRYYPSLPLPESSYVPGQTSLKKRKEFHGWKPPETTPFTGENHWRDNAFYLFGLDCFNEGHYWEAHEVWSDPLRASRGLDDRQYNFFKALIQISAVMLHLKCEKHVPAGVTAKNATGILEEIVRGHGPVYLGMELHKTIQTLNNAVANQTPDSCRLTVEL
jgi:predicted metal-dependent hydrolase